MSLDDAAIERLVGEAQAGDAWAFGRLFDHYHLPVYRFVASRVRRPSDAEDLTQLVFVKALEALPRYESRGIPFGGWLFRLARNAVIDFVRTSHEHADLAQSVDRAGTERRAGRAGGHPPGDRRDRGGPVDPDRGPARRHHTALLRRPVRPRGGRGDGQAGGNRPRTAVPGHRRTCGDSSGSRSPKRPLTPRVLEHPRIS